MEHRVSTRKSKDSRLVFLRVPPSSLSYEVSWYEESLVRFRGNSGKVLLEAICVTQREAPNCFIYHFD